MSWLDAHQFLERVCAGMGVGELLHGETFSLYDSMTAIEIGDVKMDTGLARDSAVGSPEELIAAGGAPTDLRGEQLLALFDQLLAWEATWHQHSMLPQTVFTSLYMLDVDRWVHWAWMGGGLVGANAWGACSPRPLLLFLIAVKYTTCAAGCRATSYCMPTVLG